MFFARIRRQYCCAWPCAFHVECIYKFNAGTVFPNAAGSNGTDSCSSYANVSPRCSRPRTTIILWASTSCYNSSTGTDYSQTFICFSFSLFLCSVPSSQFSLSCPTDLVDLLFKMDVPLLPMHVHGFLQKVVLPNGKFLLFTH